MPPFRFSFFGRFLLVLIGFACAVFCIYLVESVLFYAPAPQVPSFDIAPRLTAQNALGARAAKAEDLLRQQADAARAAAKSAKQADLAKAGGIKEGDAIQPFFAQADLERGRRVFARCAACHTGGKGGANRIGPNLWGIIGRPIASEQGFSYSSALKAYGQKQRHWDLAALNRFLYAPARAVPGTLMSYPGVKDLQERADVLLYLESLSDSPPQIP